MLDRDSSAALDSWDDTDFQPSRRSTILFNIPPMLLGTGRCEGLNSYLIRLAGEHSVNVRDLIRTVMVPEDASLTATQKPGFNHLAASTMNGLGPYAVAFSDTLNRQSGREDLGRLTLRPLASLLIFNGPGVLNRDRKWCPHCLADMMKEGAIPYQPLAWSFVLYQSCTLHGRLLIDRCPNCDRRQPFVPRIPVVSHCAFCRRPLFVTKHEPVESTSPPTDEMNWLSRAVENLIEFTSSGPVGDLREHLVSRVKSIIREIGEGTLRRFYLRTGLPNGMCKHWLDRAEKPTLPQLFRFCRAVGLMPRDLLDSNAGGGGLKRARAPVEAIEVRPILSRAERTGLDGGGREQLAHALSAELNASTIRNVTEIIGELNTTTTTLRYWFPLEYAELCRRARAHRNSQFASRRAEKLKWTSRFTAELAADGIAPSKHRVERLLRTKGLTMRGEGIARYFKEQKSQQNDLPGITYTHAKSDVHTLARNSLRGRSRSNDPARILRKYIKKMA